MVFEFILSRIRKALTHRGERSIACFVDGPNMIRKELNVDLDEVKEKLKEHGRVSIAKVFLNQYASDKLIEAVTNQGFEVSIVPSDVDIALAVEGTQAVFDDNVDVIAIVSRDSDFKPLIDKAKARGKKTIVVGTDPDFSTALKNSADTVINLKK